MKLFTIGFTQKSAEDFFGRLSAAGVKRLIDVRLHNTSQLAGFAKQDDLSYFAKALCGIGYQHRPDLAPSEALFESYKKKGGPWEPFARKFTALMAQRQIEKLDRKAFNGACLLCSEDKPHRCHRRLVAEYLADRWPKMKVEHL
jgi:uncharacterized protein (DUF488 family)